MEFTCFEINFWWDQQKFIMEQKCVPQHLIAILISLYEDKTGQTITWIWNYDKSGTINKDLEQSD